MGECERSLRTSGSARIKFTKSVLCCTSWASSTARRDALENFGLMPIKML